MLKKLSRRVKAAAARVAHYALGIGIAERRIKHFKERLELAEKDHHPALEERARANLSKWRIRRDRLERLKDDWSGTERRRRARKKKWLENHPDHFPKGDGGDWVIFDGLECARWIAVILQEARDAGAWTGRLISGRRSKSHSRELCEDMCGAPSCPGRCAGETSNHVGPPTFQGVEWEGAADVTDHEGLRHFCEVHRKPLVGGGAVLPADPNHFSHEGN